MTRIVFDSILFATDFSAASTAALPYAVAIARHFGSKLYLAHVISLDDYDLVPVNERDLALENIRGHAEKNMAGLRDKSLLKGVSHEMLIDHGSVWPMLSAMTEERQVSLIVIGTHGRRGVEKLLLGSVAEEILRCARVPVLMVGPSATTQEAEAMPRRIVYATDFSPASEPAMHYACRLAQEYNATLFFLHISEVAELEPLSTSMQAADFFRMRMAERGWRLAEGITPEFRVEFGPPSECILQTSDKLQIDLIVLGVRGSSYPRVAAHLPGPTAYDVVSHANCPVFVARGKDQEEEVHVSSGTEG